MQISHRILWNLRKNLDQNGVSEWRKILHAAVRLFMLLAD
jgi:hypothetical protein